MATQTSFSNILDRPSNAAERPKPLPQGSYTCVVKGLPRYDESSKKKTPFAEFTLQPLAAGEDVDQEELASMGGFTNKTIRATYYLTDDAEYRLTEFLDHLDIPDKDGEEDLSHAQRIDQSPGRQVIAFVKHRASDDGTNIFAELARTAKAE